MTFTIEQMLAFLPIFATAMTAVAAMLVVSVHRHHFFNASVTVAGLNLSLLAVLVAFQQGNQSVTGLLHVDGQACFFMALIITLTLGCCTLANAYFDNYRDNIEEFYLLITTAATGALVMVCSQHLAAFFIGLELLSVPAYGLVAYTFRNRRSLEAGIKYMVLSAAASAFLLFGMALLYSQSGTLEFAALAQKLVSGELHGSLMQLAVAMMLAGICFKLSVVPFHLWTPDVYEGAPAPASAFLATVSKVAVFAALLRLLESVPLMQNADLRMVLAVLAALSIVVGNLLALQQKSLKRLLGYSSIAHIGYILVAIVAGGPTMKETVIVYLFTYAITTLGAFGVISLMSSPFTGQDADILFEYRGLFWRRPNLTAVLTVMLLSLAGIPLTAGFIGKFYVVLTGVDANLWWLLGTVVLGSALGIFYYMRTMVTLFLVRQGMQRHDAPSNWGFQASGMLVLGLAALVLAMGMYPQPVLNVMKLMGLVAH